MEVDVEETDDETNFMAPVDQETVECCINDFIDATGNVALARKVCMVCAREVWARQADRWSVDDLPNGFLLVPRERHPAQLLTKGMLLEQATMEMDKGIMHGDVCHDCLKSLKRCKMPPLSLANDMWIGAIPTELKVLTLPERILVSRYFPAAYIVKLFPKRKGAKYWPKSGLNSGVKGNVSTYKLNTEDIADMVDTNVMPPPAKIMASTIGVTIIGPKDLPERTMPHFLRVRRDRIRDALLWLKNNNLLYANITISEPHLNQLPEDGIPQEILSCVHCSEDTEQLEKERAGYVVDDDDAMEEMTDMDVIVGGQ
jgi:hypothetical protein